MTWPRGRLHDSVTSKSWVWFDRGRDRHSAGMASFGEALAPRDESKKRRRAFSQKDQNLGSIILRN